MAQHFARPPAEDGYHCLQCPRITVGKTLVDGRLSGAYLHRRGITAEKALGSEAEVALECFALWSDVSGDSLRSVRSSAFRKHRRVSSWEPENINGKMVVPVAYETANGCGCASYAVIGQSIAGWGVMSPDATVPTRCRGRSTRAFGNCQRAAAACYVDARRIGICNAARGCRRLWPGIV
ncbi:MAG: hypothetical protein ACLTYW_10815 [Collinsella sp.]